MLAYNFGPNIIGIFHDEKSEDVLHQVSSRLINQYETEYKVNIRPFYSEVIDKKKTLKDLEMVFEPERHHLRMEFPRYIKLHKNGLRDLDGLFADFMRWRGNKSVA